MRRLLQPFIADLAPLWVGGLAILQIFLLSWTLPLEGEPFEWAQYMLLGTAFPMLVLLLNRIFQPLHALLALTCFMPVTVLIGSGWQLCLLLGVGQIMLLLVLLRQHNAANGLALTASGVMVASAVACLSWLVVSHWAWWLRFPDWLTGSSYNLAIAMGSLLLSTAVIAGLCIVPVVTPHRFGWLTYLPALALFAFLSTHVYGLGMRDLPGENMGRKAFHHWAAVVESSELVRQGAWPLWDVPTQYGFLNTWLLALLPFSSVWQSLYVCNAVLLSVSAGVVFWLLRSLRPGPLHYGFALLATVVAVFLLPGEPPELSGPFPFPSVGAYRFIGCYVLLGILAWDYDSLCAGSPTRVWTLWLGNLAWLAGTLWSAESAVFCATIWVPSYTLLALRRSLEQVPGPGRWRERLPGLAGWLVLPPLMLGAAVAGICAIYWLTLGNLPEGRCFLEYSLALQFFALPIEPAGAVGVLLLAYIVIATTGAYCLKSADPLRPLALVVGAAAALWAVSSYFVGRSHDNNITNLTPLVVAGIAAALRVLDRAGANEAWCSWIRLSLLPVFTVLLAMPFIDRNNLARYASDSANGYRADVTLLLPEVDPPLQQLLDKAEVQADTPIAFFDNHDPHPAPMPRWHASDASEPLAVTRAWLPAGSTVLYIPLTPARRHVYFERFIARTRRSGWLIRPNTEPRPELAWIIEEVERTHTPVKNLGNEQWTMSWYEYRPQE